MRKVCKIVILLLLLLNISPTIKAEEVMYVNKFGQNIQNASVNTKYSKWIDYGEKNDIDLQKSWTIEFNQNVTMDKIIAAEIVNASGELIPVNLELLNSRKLRVSPATRYMAAETYTLHVLLTSGLRYKLTFHTTSNVDSLLQPIEQSIEAQIIKVPAMPERGFKFPYYIRIPSIKYEETNKDDQRYILFDMVNNGVGDLQKTDTYVKKTLLQQNSFSVKLSEQLWTPMIMPVIPRSHVHYYDGNKELNAIFEHAYDRDTAFLQEILDSSSGPFIRAGYDQLGLNADDFVNLDKQVIAMFEHAAQYLNKNKQYVRSEKMFMAGFSASGTFVDRVSMLHPEKVKAVASGATLDDMMLPLSEYNGEKLIFPIGTADYEELTGKPFQIDLVNKMAKVVFMGAEDQNDTFAQGFSDSYGETERSIVGHAFGFQLLQRAQLLMKLYEDAGGEAQFIIEKDIGHAVSPRMMNYLVHYFAANRNNEQPVYVPFVY